MPASSWRVAAGRASRRRATGNATGSVPRDRWGTVWLCRPGLASDPCTSDLTTTVVARNGDDARIERAVPRASPPVDCFYVYPTISGQPTINANLAIGFREREVAVAQASRFSQVCRVYAPVYRQITLSALDHPGRITLADALIAYDSVLSAFRDYLAHYNHGRGIVFIGHSQGAAILIRLLKQEVDGKPAVRRRLVSALLLGGNVTVPKGRTRRRRLRPHPGLRLEPADRLRRRLLELHLEAAAEQPVRPHELRRRRAACSLRTTSRPSLKIMCVNPAAPAGGTALLDPYIPSLVLAFLHGGSAPTVQTPWVAFPGEYTGRCETSGNATWLQVHPRRRQRRRASAARAPAGPGARPAHPRRQHRARQPRPTRPRRGCVVPPDALAARPRV